MVGSAPKKVGALDMLRRNTQSPGGGGSGKLGIVARRFLYAPEFRFHLAFGRHRRTIFCFVILHRKGARRAATRTELQSWESPRCRARLPQAVPPKTYGNWNRLATA